MEVSKAKKGKLFTTVILFLLVVVPGTPENYEMKSPLAEEDYLIEYKQSNILYNDVTFDSTPRQVIEKKAKRYRVSRTS